MAKQYEVTRAWFGVKVGDVIEREELHPALRANVRPLRQRAEEADEDGELVPGTPAAKSRGNGRSSRVTPARGQ